MENNKIISAARITPMPVKFTDPLPEVFVTIGGEEVFLFDYMPDEISFTPSEFIGKTLEEARELFRKKNAGYLQ